MKTVVTRFILQLIVKLVLHSTHTGHLTVFI